ncbi:MAG TPA: hypothetical protein PLW35_09420, partial [Verrucomicrobiota bacterium]|nr:hypothetical protein [Verrucomicrobiota bacterium]
MQTAICGLPEVAPAHEQNTPTPELSAPDAAALMLPSPAQPKPKCMDRHWPLAGAKRLDAVGAGRREAPGVRQLAAALSLCPNNVPVPIWPQRMPCALAGAKRLECGSLLPLCLYAQTPCLSPYPMFPISPMTGHAARFDPQIRPPDIHRLGAGKNARAPARAG